MVILTEILLPFRTVLIYKAVLWRGLMLFNGAARSTCNHQNSILSGGQFVSRMCCMLFTC